MRRLIGRAGVAAVAGVVVLTAVAWADGEKVAPDKVPA